MEPASLSQTHEGGPVGAAAGPRARNWIGPALALATGAALRVWMLREFFEVSGDSQVYGGLAKVLLQNGTYALEVGDGVFQPTLIRLPGYPLFLAGIFKVFGMENYYPACIVQIVLDLAGCLLLALFAARIAGQIAGGGRGAGFGAGQARRAALATLWVSACCPFTAIFCAAPLSESLTLFCIAMALWAVGSFGSRPAWGSGLAFAFAVSYAALLRPDGALVGVVLAPAAVIGLIRSKDSSGRAVRIAVTCALLAITPFAVWTMRNWRVLHVFQPLAPRYANDPGDSTMPGWQAWMKTWCLDFVSTYDIYWSAPKGPLDVGKLPARAFDSATQYAETARLFQDYEKGDEELSPEIDARFAELAAQRVAAHPLRSHVLLPVGRMLDMWLRPRVENLPIDLDWWVYEHHNAETRFSWFYVALNLAYLLLALEGLRRRPPFWGCMLAFFLLRSALLCTIEAPEARYTIECFPMMFVLAGVVLSRPLRGGASARRTADAIA